ncbi:hypothetical protein J6590_046845 [Homalodisca vitripennis]|nr:hypothetical protein J6590_046845 [Homalodisca vitripennis]
MMYFPWQDRAARHRSTVSCCELEVYSSLPQTTVQGGVTNGGGAADHEPSPEPAADYDNPHASWSFENFISSRPMGIFDQKLSVLENSAVRKIEPSRRFQSRNV